MLSRPLTAGQLNPMPVTLGLPGPPLAPDMLWRPPRGGCAWMYARTDDGDSVSTHQR